MKRIKNILLALVALAFALPAVAQQYSPVSLISSRVVLGSQTSNYNLTIGATKYRNVGLQVSFALMEAGTDNVTLTFDRSLDGTTWSTVGNVSVVAAGTGTTPVVYVTNIAMNAMGYLRLKSAANGGTPIVTNLTVKYVLKPADN